VLEVVEDSPAGTAGIRPGDLILELDEQAIESAGDLQRMMVAELIGRRVRALVWRSGEEIDLEVTPAELE
jgi:S1-C subfamily serine protease